MRKILASLAFLGAVASAHAQTAPEMQLNLCTQQLTDTHNQCDANQRQTVIVMQGRIEAAQKAQQQAEQQRDWLWQNFGAPAYKVPVAAPAPQ